MERRTQVFISNYSGGEWPTGGGDPDKNLLEILWELLVGGVVLIIAITVIGAVAFVVYIVATSFLRSALVPIVIGTIVLLLLLLSKTYLKPPYLR